MGRVGNIGGDEDLVGQAHLTDKEKESLRKAKIRDVIFNGAMFVICLYIPISRKTDGA